MDNPNTNNPNSRIHTPNIQRRPLLWAAAIAVILLVLAGIAAMNKGWSPNANSTANRSDDRTASASGTTGKSGTSGSNQSSPSFNDSGSAGSTAPRQPAPLDPTTTRRQ